MYLNNLLTTSQLKLSTLSNYYYYYYSLKLLSIDLYALRCPAGWVSTEEGSCTDDNECLSSPGLCNNDGQCINFDNGQGFLCMCKPGFTGDLCNLPVQEKMILVASGAYWVIAFVLVNVIGKTSSISQALPSRSLNHPHSVYLLSLFTYKIYF